MLPEQQLRPITTDSLKAPSGCAGIVESEEEPHEGQGSDNVSAVRAGVPTRRRSNVQEALEGRGVYPDPARRIAERAFRLGVGEKTVLACFEAHLTALERNRVSNPVGAVVWRLLHRPLVVPKRRRAQLAELFFGEEDQEALERLSACPLEPRP